MSSLPALPYDSRSPSGGVETESGDVSLPAVTPGSIRGAKFYTDQAIMSHKRIIYTAIGNRTPVIQPVLVLPAANR